MFRVSDPNSDVPAPGWATPANPPVVVANADRETSPALPINPLEALPEDCRSSNPEGHGATHQSSSRPELDKVAKVTDLGNAEAVIENATGQTLPPLSTANPSGIASYEEELEEHGFLPVLRNWNFLALWSGQVFSQLADKVYLVLMIALIDGRFQAENQTISGWVSSIMIAFTIPAVLFGSIAGAFVDRWSKKAVLIGSNILRGLLVLSLPFLLWLAQGWPPIAGLPLGFYILLGVTLAVSTLTQFFAPAEQAVIPIIVPHRNLLSANSLYTTTMIGSVIVGFAVGEPLLVLAGRLLHAFLPDADLGQQIVVGGAYLIAGLLMIPINRDTQNLPTEHEPPHILQDIQDGLKYLAQQPRVRSAMIQLGILSAVFAALSVLAVRLAEVLPEINTAQFGFLLAAGGVGIAVGALVIGSLGKRLGSHLQLSLCGSFGMGLALTSLAFSAHSLWLSLLLIVCLGFAASLVGIPMQTTIQAETPEEMRGKVFGLQNNAVNIALSLPLALVGVAETFLGLQVVFLGLATIAIAGGILTWYISRRR